MHSKYCLICFFLSLTLVGCSFMPNEIKTAQKIMETNPDSALHILQHMQPNQTLTDADRALYGILLFQALEKNNKPLKPDSVINFSINYYKNKNDNTHLATCYFYKGRIYKIAQRFDDATILYLKALDISQNNKDYVLLGKIYSDMGDICLIQKDYNESLKKHQKSIECFQQAGDTIEACYKIIDVGRVYRFLKDYKKAQQQYKLALLQSPDSILHGTAYQEIGINYYWAKQYDSAQFFLRKSLKFPYKGTNYAIRCYILADLYFDRNQYDSAFHYANVALKYPSTFFNQRDCYRILANTEYSRGNIKQMAFYMSKYQDCSDSVRKIEIQTKTSILEDLHQTNGAVSKTKQFLFVLGCVIALILILSFFIVFRLRVRNKGKEKQLELAEEEISKKQTLLRDGLIRKIEENKASQASNYKKAAISQRESMDKEIYNTCLHLNDWDSFKILMNQTFNNIITILETTYPDVNHKEMIWCCLFLLDIPTPDISLVLDSQPSSLYKLKQRLAQKMNLKSTKELDQLLYNLSEGK